ncbi:MAG: hypothetical protein ACAI25_19220 [Planctomycetota bacterium]
MFSAAEDDLIPEGTGGADSEAPIGVKFLICFLLVDAVRRVMDLLTGGTDGPGSPIVLIFILWIAINLLLALLLGLRTRAGRYWTQAILAIHVFYIGHELSVRAPHLWLSMGVVARARILATVFLDGIFVAYLSGQQAKFYLQDGP